MAGYVACHLFYYKQCGIVIFISKNQLFISRINATYDIIQFIKGTKMFAGKKDIMGGFGYELQFYSGFV